jgi:integrase/recombinase XerD
MASLKRAAIAVAAILVREGIDYAQSKAVFKAARERAGLRAAPERRGGVDRLSVEEELRFLDQAYARDGRTGMMLQTLLETGARSSELVQIRVEDVSLAERVITIRQGKGGKRREVPIRRELAQLLRLHIGTRRAGPLFANRQEGSGPTPHVLTRQRVGQIVRAVAVAAGIGKRVYPHLLRHTVATRLLALGMDRPTALPRPREHRDDPALCRNHGRHAPAPLRPAHRSRRACAGRRNPEAARRRSGVAGRRTDGAAPGGARHHDC